MIKENSPFEKQKFVGKEYLLHLLSRTKKSQGF